MSTENKDVFFCREDEDQVSRFSVLLEDDQYNQISSVEVCVKPSQRVAAHLVKGLQKNHICQQARKLGTCRLNISPDTLVLRADLPAGKVGKPIDVKKF